MPATPDQIEAIERATLEALRPAAAQASAAPAPRGAGVGQAFLQVEADNAPALALYRRFGFQTAWTYHYWKVPVSAAAYAHSC